MTFRHCFLVGLFTVSVSAQLLCGQQSTVQIPERRVSSYIDENGTAYITRVVNVPESISVEAQKTLIAQHMFAPPETRPRQLRQLSADSIMAAYPVHIEFSSIAGVPVSVVRPPAIPAGKVDRVLINLHGGGFTSDSGSLTESIPIANLTKTKVISVMYRLAPEHTFPAQVDDVVAVYKELLKTHAARHMVIYGSSAGAVLTPEVAVKLKQLGLPLPGALGIFSGGATSPGMATRNKFMVCTGLSVTRTLGLRAYSGWAFMSALPTLRTRFCLPCLQIYAGCRRHYL